MGVRGFLLQGLVGIPALALATSCVPGDHPAPLRHAQAVPDSRALLRRMALSVPDDIPAKALASDDDRHAAFVATAAPPFVAAPRTIDDAARATDCLTAAVYYEARSQSLDGQRAVAQVVLNRVRDRAFPNTVCGVVYQGSQRRTGCQFSFTCDGSLYRPREPAAWERARGVAEAALAGSVYAPVGAATSYHASSILPWWASSLTQVAQIGEHIFYRWQGGLARALTFRQNYAGFEPSAPAASGGVAMQSAGVTVHHGGEAMADATEAAGVVVHRGAVPFDAATDAPLRPRATFVSGVRVHVGGHRPEPGGAGDGGAVVSEESAPI